MIEPTDLLPQGLEDRLPDCARSITAAMRAALDVLDANGYDRVRPPLLEYESSLASRMLGVKTERCFRMTDPSSLRTLALRSDITPQVGRIASTSMKNAARPLRLCYCGDTALISANQLDPARERLQLGAELIGADTQGAACEIVVLAIEALLSAGLSGISVDFTMPDLMDALTASDETIDTERLEAIRRELDTKDAGGLQAVGGEAYLPLLYAAGPIETAVAELKQFDKGRALETRLKSVLAIAEQVNAAAEGRISMSLDPTERHGFEYQSWFGFTIYAEGVRGAAGRGGTYTIAGSEEPATGFTLYLDRLSDALGETHQPDLVFLPLGHDTKRAQDLRKAGARTLMQISEGEDPVALGCTHVLDHGDVRPLG